MRPRQTHRPGEIGIHDCISKGSESDLLALLDRQADFAIVQGDVSHQFWHCEESEAPLNSGELQDGKLLGAGIVAET